MNIEESITKKTNELISLIHEKCTVREREEVRLFGKREACLAFQAGLIAGKLEEAFVEEK